MYTLVNVLVALAYLAVFCIAMTFAVPIFAARRSESQVKQRKQKVGQVPTFEHESEVVSDVRKAQKASLDFMGLPSIHAGRSILNVPMFRPEQEGAWEGRRTVLTTSRITALLRQGEVPGELIELDGGYVLFATNGKSFLLQNHLLTGSEEGKLEKERQEAVEKGDAVIQNFQGLTWTIGTACGSHTPKQTGGKRQSTIQVLSSHSDLGQNGIASCLPPNLFDRREHDYYDMRVRSSDNRVMLFFFTGGKWNCFIGRELSLEETQRLQAL